MAVVHTHELHLIRVSLWRAVVSMMTRHSTSFGRRSACHEGGTRSDNTVLLPFTIVSSITIEA